MIERSLADPFFALSPPKSTGREYFSNTFLNERFLTNKGRMSEDDLIATATEVTARSIANSIKTFCPDLENLEISGGGSKNHYMTSRIQTLLPQVKVSTARHHIYHEFREAIGFAIFGYRRFHQIKSALTTGSNKPLLLGELVFP